MKVPVVKKETGGAAFASSGRAFDRNPGGREYSINMDGGMTLRDYFAAKAMQGLIIKFSGTAGYTSVHIATDAYTIADAMIKERDK